MRLNEITESSDHTAVEWTTRTDKKWTTEATIGAQAITCTVKRLSPGAWSYSFTAKSPKRRKDDPPTGGRTEAMQALGFVTGALTDFIERMEPEQVMFSGAVSGLAGLFQAMAKYMEPKIQAQGYEISGGADGAFVIQRPHYTPGQTLGRRA